MRSSGLNFLFSLNISIYNKSFYTSTPDDETALARHESYGKTELWYIVDAAPDAKIYLGFNRETTPQELYDRCNNNTFMNCSM